MKKIIISLTLLLLSGLYFSQSISTSFYIATGFSTKNICSGHFISRFDANDVSEESLKPISVIFKILDYTVDESKKTVTANILGTHKQTALYREGLGCTNLVINDNAETISTAITPMLPEQKPSTEPWPKGNSPVEKDNDHIDYQLLNNAISNAFSETEEKGKRHVKSILIIHKGVLVAEQYADGVDITTPLLSWSMSKSIINLQVALLVKDGTLDIFQPADVPAWSSINDPRSKITLDQLLRMSSGLEFNESYGLNTDVSQMLSMEISASDYAADKPLEYPTDTHWSYSSGTTNIISGITKRAIGGNFQQYYEYMQKELFHPLGIYSAIQEVDASDTFIGSSYFYANSRDWAKLGQMMLQNGQWEGKQILPLDWVKYTTTPTKTSSLNNYGAHFWLNEVPDDKHIKRNWPSAPEDTYYMGGYQGQYVIVIPSEDLVVVRFGFSNPGTNHGIDRLLGDTIKAVSN